VTQSRAIEEVVNGRETVIESVVSVILPTYNRPDSLKNALESISGQTFKNL
jgi:hypothetical protein